MRGHTPGPWFVVADNAPDCPDHANSGLAMVDTGRDGDWPVARLCEWQNAEAIAQLPELEAKCKRLEAENAKLREALEAIAGDTGNGIVRCSPQHIARQALK